jgi:transposase InsO family protein
VDVSVSGYYAWRTRPASARSLRRAWLTERIRAVHVASRGTYGAARVHAELRLGHGIIVGHNAVELLMCRAGIKGLPTQKYRRLLHRIPTASDLVNREFTRGAPDLLWVTDITEHRTREGQGLLRCRARLLLPPRRRLVHRRVLESFWGPYADGAAEPPEVETRIELASAIFDYLEIFHNRQRRHSSLGMLTPNDHERLHTTLSVA